MTAYLARKLGRSPEASNRKDGGRRQQLVRQTGFWGVDGFLPTRQPDRWTYGPFVLVQGVVDFRPGWIAICEDGRRIPIGTDSAEEIRVRLDDEIADMTGVGETIGIDDWMLECLPQTNPPANTRPGAEYGVWT